MIRPFLLAIAALAIAAPGASAHDAEIFATNNTATITDAGDPRLDAHLDGFARRVEAIVRDGGGRARGSDLLDGVFFDSGLNTTTFERSRVFDVDRVDAGELYGIAETVRRRFLQGSVLTFAPRAGGDAVELDVPRVTANALRAGLLADADARERLFGGSVTLDGHLRLVADRADADFARAFAKAIGGDVKHAKTAYGDREFVSAATDGRARIEKRTLVIAGTGADDTVALRGGHRLRIDFGDDGVVDFEVSRRRFDRIRVDGGDGFDTVIRRDPGSVKLAAADFDAVERIDVAGADRVTVDDLDPAAVQEVNVDLTGNRGELDRVTVNGSDGDDFPSAGGSSGTVFVIGGPTFVRIEGADTTDRLRLNGRDGRDLLSTSTAAMRTTLDGGEGDNTIVGGPGDDVLIGGDGFDDIDGDKGDDVAYMGANFDRFSWAPGDGSDEVHGGGSNDSIFVTGSDAAERFGVTRHRDDVRFTRDLDSAVIDLDGVEEIDAIALGGADVFHIGDLHGTGVREVNPSLAPSFGTANGDGAADRVELTGGEDDDVTVTGQTVVSGAVTVNGLAAKVGVSHSDGLLDTLAIQTGGAIDSSGMAPGTIGLETP